MTTEKKPAANPRTRKPAAKKPAQQKHKIPKLETVDKIPLIKMKNPDGRDVYVVKASARLAKFNTIYGLQLNLRTMYEMIQNDTQAIVTSAITDRDGVVLRDVSIHGYTMAEGGINSLSSLMTRAQSKVLASFGIGIGLSPEVEAHIGGLLEVADEEAMQAAKANAPRAKAKANKNNSVGDPNASKEPLTSLLDGLTD